MATAEAALSDRELEQLAKFEKVVEEVDLSPEGYQLLFQKIVLQLREAQKRKLAEYERECERRRSDPASQSAPNLRPAPCPAALPTWADVSPELVEQALLASPASFDDAFDKICKFLGM